MTIFLANFAFVQPCSYFIYRTNVHVERSRKVPVSTILRSLGPKPLFWPQPSFMEVFRHQTFVKRLKWYEINQTTILLASYNFHRVQQHYGLGFYLQSMLLERQMGYLRVLQSAPVQPCIHWQIPWLHWPLTQAGLHTAVGTKLWNISQACARHEQRVWSS